jgi:hypothetical protein
MLERFRNRTISEADADALHPGMRRFAKLHAWKVVPEVDPNDPSGITLQALALATDDEVLEAELDNDDDDGDDGDDGDDDDDGKA